MNRIEPSLNDPFVYLSEPGKMKKWPATAIKKELGATNADTIIKLKILVPVDYIWINASRNAIHYAIAGIISSAEILSLSIQKRKEKYGS